MRLENNESALSAMARIGRMRLVRRFVRREDGTITTFALMIFVMMVAVGGIAIDIMRYETQRAQLQYTLDRAVLAAASVSQPLNPVAVVENYFEISGLENYRLNVNVEEGINFRRVNAYAELEMNTLFMHMFGVRVLTSPATGAAEERIRNVEISMVLDVSGSMEWQSRITNMRNAAREFVTTVLEANETDQGNLVSISIVPYNGMVNAGSTIASVFNLSDEHNHSNCARFSADQFSRTALSPSEEIERLAHWDWNSYFSYTFNSGYCPTNNTNAIMPWSHDETALHNYINGLGAEGWTAIDLGMRWGVALLDPAARPALNSLVSGGTVHLDFQDRPANIGDPETIKVVVLMTDGENTQQWDVRQPYKRGPSPIFFNESANRYSIFVPSRNQYWIPNSTPNTYSGTWSAEPFGGTASTALSWPHLWATYTGRYIAEHFLTVPSHFSGDWALYNQIRTNGDQIYANTAEGDANLRQICDEANAAGMIIFAIGFEAPAGGQAVMRHCASSDAHYYDVQGIEISDAFASIARTINQLRLIQ
jgi:hypothetical protein